MRRTLVAGACMAAVVCSAARAAELTAPATRAYDAYLAQARRAFLTRLAEPVPVPSGMHGVRTAGPGRGDGITSVEGGLVHHWIGTAFVRGSSLSRVLDVARDYAAYDRIYDSVVGAQLIEHGGDNYTVKLRFKEGELGITAVLDVRSTIQYVHSSGTHAYAMSNADEIRQVEDAGTRNERLLPAGRDSGFLWRANTFSRFVAQTDGVYLEVETLGLSRPFPLMTGLLIEPIARRLGRKSVEGSLREFVEAIQAR